MERRSVVFLIRFVVSCSIPTKHHSCQTIIEDLFMRIQKLSALILTVCSIAALAQLPSAQAAAGDFTPLDIGSPGVAGSVTQAGGGYDITAGGTNVYGASDQFTFNSQPITGDFDLRVRVAGLTLADTWSKAGLMARETLVANSRYAATFATPSASGAFFQYRTNSGAAAVNNGAYPVNYPNTWLRLQRAGNLFTSSASLDGAAWYQLGSATIPMTTSAFVGMAVSASVTNGSPVTTSTAQFRDFGTVSGATVATSLPDVEPAGPSSRQIGRAHV